MTPTRREALTFMFAGLLCGFTVTKLGQVLHFSDSLTSAIFVVALCLLILDQGRRRGLLGKPDDAAPGPR